MALLIQYPTRERPETARKILSIWDNGRVDFHVVINDDDATMADFQDYGRVKIDRGKGLNKILAVNYGLQDLKWDIVVVVSDDSYPAPDYDLRILDLYQKHLPNGGCLHAYDGRQKNTITQTIMSRNYYDTKGYIYHPDYVSLWSDVELTEVAQMEGRYYYTDEMLIFHDWNSVPYDRLRNETESHYKDDEQTYNRRKAQGFPR